MYCCYLRVVALGVVVRERKKANCTLLEFSEITANNPFRHNEPAFSTKELLKSQKNIQPAVYNYPSTGQQYNTAGDVSGEKASRPTVLECWKLELSMASIRGQLFLAKGLGVLVDRAGLYDNGQQTHQQYGT